MKLTRKSLIKIIKDNILKEAPDGLYPQTRDVILGQYKSDVKTGDTIASRIFEKAVLEPILGSKVETDFKKWCASNKENFRIFINDPDAKLIFNGYQLKIISKGEPIMNFSAGSGFTGKYAQLPITKDKTSMSSVKNKGPTPPGAYTIEEMQVSGQNPRGQNWLSNMAWYGRGVLKKLPGTSRIMSGFGSVKWSAFAKSAWGNYRALLKPATQEQVTFYEKESGKKYTRDSMYIHGGAKQQSAGCIDLATGDKDGMDIFGPLYSLWYVKNRIPIVLEVEYDD